MWSIGRERTRLHELKSLENWRNVDSVPVMSPDCCSAKGEKSIDGLGPPNCDVVVVVVVAVLRTKGRRISSRAVRPADQFREGTHTQAMEELAAGQGLNSFAVAGGCWRGRTRLGDNERGTVDNVRPAQQQMEGKRPGTMHETSRFK